LCVRSWDKNDNTSCNDRCSHVEDIYDFEVGQELGAGGFGIVRKAIQRRTNEVHAIKTSMRVGPTSELLVRHEIDILGELHHPCICPLIDTFEDRKHIHMVLEYIDGHDLFTEISEQHLLDEARAAGIMQQVFSALQHCHERSIIHRDVKPENIMVYRKELRDGMEGANVPMVKLIDFGLATRYDESVQEASSSCLMGCFDYLAPEAKTGYAMPASDVFSAGVILHLLLTGSLPSKDDIAEGRRLNTCNHWALVSADAKDLVCRVLKATPTERLTAEEAAAHPWSQHITSSSPRRETTLEHSEELCEASADVFEDLQTPALAATALASTSKRRDMISMDSAKPCELPIGLSEDLQTKALIARASLLAKGFEDENSWNPGKTFIDLVIASLSPPSESIRNRARRLLQYAVVETTESISENLAKLCELSVDLREGCQTSSLAAEAPLLLKEFHDENSWNLGKMFSDFTIASLFSPSEIIGNRARILADCALVIPTVWVRAVMHEGSDLLDEGMNWIMPGSDGEASEKAY
jgi:serine/threonine protein kinase